MTTPACGKCRFFRHNVEGEDSLDGEFPTGECHRYAPRPLVGSLNDASTDTLWPVNFATEWCGEFESATEPKQTSADESRWSEFRNCLSVRVGNCLDSESIDSFAKLDAENPWSLRKMRNFGSTSFHALRDIRRQFPGYPTHWDKERKTP